MSNKVQVTKEEFEEFINKYNTNIHELVRDTCHISTPPLVSYNDFSLGNWPDSIVASMCWGEIMYGYFKTKEENDKNCINEYYIKSKYLTEEYKEIMKIDYKECYNQMMRDIVKDEEYIRTEAGKVLDKDEIANLSNTEIVIKLVDHIKLLDAIMS
jgi:hypothetical protein